MYRCNQGLTPSRWSAARRNHEVAGEVRGGNSTSQVILFQLFQCGRPGTCVGKEALRDERTLPSNVGTVRRAWTAMSQRAGTDVGSKLLGGPCASRRTD